MRILTVLLLALTLASPASAKSDLLGTARNLLGSFGGSGSGSSTSLASGEIVDGLKEALRVGAEKVVAQVGAPDGFNADPAIHIPLTDEMRTVQKWLGKIGMSGMADDLETRMNRAAETASGEAKALFWDSIKQMTLDDAKGILNGPDDAATQYFKGKMSTPLKAKMEPLVDAALTEAGAVKVYDSMMANYKSIPFVPDLKADLKGHVLDKALDGIFLYVAKEEAAIRNNPAARTTDLLKKVFAN